MYLMLAIVTTSVGIYEGIPLVKKKLWKEFITLIFLTLIIIILLIIKILNLPTPLEIIENLLYPLGKTIYRNK